MEFDIRQMLFGVGSSAVQSFRTGNPNTDNYAQAAARLLQHAGNWSAVSQSGLKCTIRQRTPIGTTEVCGAPAIGACVVCNQPTCFNHSMISPHDGTLICFGCVGSAQASHRTKTPPRGGSKSPPPSDPDISDLEKRSEYLLVLGLTSDASWFQVQAVYKALVKEHHPDKHPASRRKEQEKKLKKFNEAFGWLKTYYEKEAA